MRKTVAGISIAILFFLMLSTPPPADAATRAKPTPVVILLPPARIIVPKTCTEASFTVFWEPSPTSQVAYQLQEATDPLFTTDLRLVYKGRKTSVRLSGGTNGQTYYYRVRATRNNYTPSKWTIGEWGCLINRRAGAPSFITVPAASDTGSYQVSWGVSAMAGVGYELEEATAPGFDAGLRTVYTGGLLQANITERTNKITYYYRVRATRAGWYPSAWVAGANGCAVSWPDPIPPGPVTGFTATPAASRVDLAWFNPADADFAGVKVLRRTDRFPADAADGSLVYDGSGQTGTDSGLGAGTYYYAAFAYDTSSNFAAAATVSASVVGASCSDCHGTGVSKVPLPAGAIYGQYWPDGSATAVPAYDYANDQTGAHRKHIDALALQLWGETAGELVADFSPVNPTLTASVKQVAVCLFCHPDPGEDGHLTNDGVRDPADRATVYLDTDDTTGQNDVFRKLTVGARASGKDLSGINGDQAYSYANANCANLVCHNQVPTPSGANNWNDPPDWSAGINSKCSNTTCHATATYTLAHAAHVSASQKNYKCHQCHANNYSPTPNLGHGNGEVDMAWNNAGAVEAVSGGGDGFYDKDKSGGVAPSTGDTGFAYKSGGYDISCRLVYCHGDDNTAVRPPDWGGSDTTPVWNNATTASCGFCHGGNGTAGDMSVTATGNHTDHLNATHGPNFGNAACQSCHTNWDVPVLTATHVDGSVQFANIDITNSPSATLGTSAPAGAPAADNTDRCNNCHSTATVNGVVGAAVAKQNWSNGAYQLDCLTCHNAADPGSNNADGTGRLAPNVAGDGVNYGAAVRGHNRPTAGGPPSGPYPVSNNPAANLGCAGCHDAAAIHINNGDDTSYAGHRMLGTIMGITGLATPTGACNACHANAASTAAKKNVNTHANADYAGRLEAVFAALECLQCHEPHGMTANGTGYNIYMVPSRITVVPGTTVSGVRFENRTGNYSLNDAQDTPADDLCVVCHANTANPGFGMTYDADGRHSATPGYGNDERGKNCSNCHNHNKDNSLATADGFMPALLPTTCEGCHNGNPSFPLAPNVINGTLPSSFSLNYNWAGTEAGKQDGGHGDPEGKAAAILCEDCHDTSQPPGDLHLNGVYESIWDNATRTANTAHLKAEFFTAYPANGPGTWSIQVAFDNYCYRRCHATQSVPEMTHEGDTKSSDANHNSCEFGTHGSVANGDALRGGMAYPIDRDLNTNAIGPPNYATCVSCHDPHGTTQTYTQRTSNRMLRGERTLWICNVCH